jgi:PST family polysaccharide transporter
MDPVLRKNFSYLFLLQNVNYIVPLLLLPYLTRTLGAENFGKIAFVQAFVSYFISLTDFGFNISSTQEIVRIRNDKSALSRVYWSTTIAKLSLTLLGFAAFLLLILLIPKLQQMYVLLMIAFIGVFSSVLFPIWLFQGLEKMSHITWFNVVPKILVLILTILLVRHPSDYVLALLLQTGGVLFSAIACTLFIVHKKTVGFYFPNFREIHLCMKDSWHFYVAGVATNFYTTTNTVVLGLLTNNATVGVFAASEKIIRPLISLFSTIHQVTFPRINYYYLESEEKAFHFGSRVLKITVLATLLVGLSIFLLAPSIVKILFGIPQYAETITLLKISSFLPFLAVGNGVLAYNFLITSGLKRHMIKAVVMGGIFNLLLIVPTILLYKTEGVAVIAILSEVVITIYFLFVFKKHHIKIKW